MPERLPPKPGEKIDREKRFHFRFDGQQVAAFEGDTIASALAACGRTVLSRSFKYHRPRGLLCCSGHCPNCLVQVGDESTLQVLGTLNCGKGEPNQTIHVGHATPACLFKNVDVFGEGGTG